MRTASRGSDLPVREVDHLRHATFLTWARYPFDITEIVVLGDVIHMIWTMPGEDDDASRQWRMLKSLFSRAVPAPNPMEMQWQRFSETGIWQGRLHEHVISDTQGFAARRHMILRAPVRAGLVDRPEHWRHSSVHRPIRQGAFKPGKARTPAHGSVPLQMRDEMPLLTRAMPEVSSTLPQTV